MRTKSVLKAISLAAALAIVAGVPSAFAAKHHYRYTRRPATDACLFHRHFVAAGTICSYDCNPNSLGCSAQICVGGHWTQALPCLRPFCLQMCG